MIDRNVSFVEIVRALNTPNVPFKTSPNQVARIVKKAAEVEAINREHKSTQNGSKRTAAVGKGPI